MIVFTEFIEHLLAMSSTKFLTAIQALPIFTFSKLLNS